MYGSKLRIRCTSDNGIPCGAMQNKVRLKSSYIPFCEMFLSNRVSVQVTDFSAFVAMDILLKVHLSLLI